MNLSTYTNEGISTTTTMHDGPHWAQCYEKHANQNLTGLFVSVPGSVTAWPGADDRVQLWITDYTGDVPCHSTVMLSCSPEQLLLAAQRAVAQKQARALHQAQTLEEAK